MTLPQVRELAQQHPRNERHHLYMYVEPISRSKHARSRDGDFDDYLLTRSLRFDQIQRVERQTSAAVDEMVSAFEGEQRRRFILHRHRERALRQAKVESVRRATGGLRCEVPGCGFSFAQRYGEVGEGYVQVHHRRPLAEADAPVETRLEDLAIVCANCHAMIHRGGENRSLDALISHA
jgi:predicted HNH restriction endonuclease